MTGKYMANIVCPKLVKYMTLKLQTRALDKKIHVIQKENPKI